MLGRGDDPFNLALAFRDQLGLNTVYVADLDAIAGGAIDLVYLRSLADAGIMPWVDAGIKTADTRRMLEDVGVAKVIVATETLPLSHELEKIVQAGTADRLIFSLDLHQGRPIVSGSADWGSPEPFVLLDRALKSGFSRFLLLDKARMGTGLGTGNLDLIAEVRGRYPEANLSVGGGISGIIDLKFLFQKGINNILVGTALHDGRITRADLDDLGSSSDPINLPL